MKIETMDKRVIAEAKKCIAQQDYAEALGHLNRALRCATLRDEALFLSGQVLFLRKEYGPAIRQLKKALAANPADANCRLLLAKAYRFAGKLRLAHQEFEALQNIGAHLGEVYREMGFVHKELFDHGRAVTCWENSLKMNPDDDELWRELGAFYGIPRSGDPLEKDEAPMRAMPDACVANRKLNDTEISQRKIILASKPRGLGVALTNRCNLRCVMCGVPDTPRDLPPKVLNEIYDMLPYLEQVYWKGGEVFLYPGFEALYDAACRYPHLYQEISTNGLLITRAWAEKLVAPRVNLSLSIDAFTPQAYAAIRRGGSLKKIITNINMINAVREKKRAHGDDLHAFHFMFNFVVMKSNYRELKKILAFARKYNFNAVKISPVERCPQEEFTTQERRRLAPYFSKTRRLLERQAHKYGIRLFYLLPDDAPAADRRRTEVPNDGLLCLWPWQYISLSEKGEVMPYECFCQKSAGSVFNASLKEIWNNTRMQTYRKKILERSMKGWCNNACTAGVIPRDHLRMRDGS